MKFEVGYRVRAVANCEKAKVGYMGTVIGSYMSGDTNHFCVEFDENVRGHDGNSVANVKGKSGHCWWYHSNQNVFEIVKRTDKKIVITTDGAETLARLFDGNKVIKTATAKCSPADTFDFATGAEIAFNRLMGVKAVKEEKKPLTFREKLKQEHPERVVETCLGGCYGCPSSYGYEAKGCPKKQKKVATCSECWDREIPEKEEPKKEENLFKFEVGKQYQRTNLHGDLVIEITRQYQIRQVRRYEYRVVKGIDIGKLDFAEYSRFGQELKPYDPPKYFNGKAVCVKSDKDFTVGKVYEFVDGQTTDNQGTTRQCGYRVEKSFDEWKQKSGDTYDFLPIVE